VSARLGGLQIVELSELFGFTPFEHDGPSFLLEWLEVPGVVLSDGSYRYRVSEIEEYLQTQDFKRRKAALRAERKAKISAKEPDQDPKPQPANP